MMTIIFYDYHIMIHIAFSTEKMATEPAKVFHWVAGRCDGLPGEHSL